MPKITRDEDEDWTPPKRPMARRLKRKIDRQRARRKPRKRASELSLLGDGEPLSRPTVRPRRLVTLRLPAPRYIVDPAWGPSSAATGASWMEVTIGPLQGGPGFYGRPPAANTPSIMRRLLDGRYNAFGWVAGPLLNDNLGGPGVAANLTPLTTAGNKNHLGACEIRIKNFINEAYSRTILHPEDTHYFGVWYRVEVGSTCWDATDPVLRHVATELRVWAKVVKLHKLSGDLSDAGMSETPITQWFHPLANEAVDNTGYDLLPAV